MITRKKTRQVRAGSLLIGGGAPVSIQSMTNVPIEDVEGTMPGDRTHILEAIDRYLGMNDDGRESFIIGRRLGIYRLLSDFAPDPQVEAVKLDLKHRFGSIDAAVLELLKNFI